MRKLFLLYSLVLLFSQAVGQGFADTLTDQIIDRLTLQRSMFPQEKVHVMTDRELYQPGDTVWLRAWVVEGESLTPFSHGSRFVYVEIRDAANTLLRCVKLIEREGRFAGQLVLPKELKTGDYTLTAFTYYNLSSSEEFLFKKNIHVITPTDAQRGFTARPLLEGYRPEAPELNADQNRPYTIHRRDSLMRVTIVAPDSTWLSISLTDDQLTPVDTAVTLARMLPAIPDLFTPETLLPDSQYYRPTFHYERRQGIAGQVRTPNRKQVNTIVMVDMNKPAVYSTFADNRGNFSFHDNLTFSDSTLIAIVGYQPNGTMISDLQIADYTLPKQLHHLPSDTRQYFVNRYKDTTPPTASDTTSARKKDNVKLDKKLKEILEAKDLDDIYARLSNKSRLTATLSDYKFHNLKEMVGKFDGIYFDGEVAMYEEEGYDPAPVRFIVRNKEFPIQKDKNGNYMPQTALKFPVEVIYAVDFIDPDRASSLGRTDYPDSPVIRIDLKTENEMLHEAAVNQYVKLQKPLGYVTPLVFPNLRVVHQPMPTRYWNPAVFTGHSGRISLDLPIPSDIHTTYTLRVEGITPHGEPVSLIFRITK